MSIHSSLRSGSGNKKHRSVLKRYERLKALKDKNIWSQDKSVLGIPKVKMQKLKVKKEKAVAAEGVSAGAAPAAKPAEAASSKGGSVSGIKADKK